VDVGREESEVEEGLDDCDEVFPADEVDPDVLCAEEFAEVAEFSDVVLLGLLWAELEATSPEEFPWPPSCDLDEPKSF